MKCENCGKTFSVDSQYIDVLASGGTATGPIMFQNEVKYCPLCGAKIEVA